MSRLVVSGADILFGLGLCGSSLLWNGAKELSG
jgi:hypothetical protein